MKKIILLQILCATIFSQTLEDPVYFNYYNQSDINNNSLGMQFFESQLTIAIINLTDKTKLINSIYYRYSEFNFDDKQLNYSNELNDIRITNVSVTEINKKYDFVTIARLLIRSDFRNDFDRNHMFPFLLALANYKVNQNPNFKIGLGIALNSDFNYNAIIPIVTFKYVTNKLNIEAVYPNINVIYKHSENWDYGLFASVDG